VNPKRASMLGESRHQVDLQSSFPPGLELKGLQLCRISTRLFDKPSNHKLKTLEQGIKDNTQVPSEIDNIRGA
jgi:hypothetical protein